MSVRVCLLGEFQVKAGQRVLSGEWAQRRVLDLVKLLALAPGHRLPREQVVEALWPHLASDAGFANLHRAASAVRGALGAKDAVVLRGGQVLLSPNVAVSTDVAEFEREAALALGTRDARRCANVAAGYRGGVLPADPYAEWVEPARARLRHRYVELLRCAGRWDELINAEPADEEAHRAVIRELCAHGRRQAAIQEARRLGGALGALGLGPAPATVRLWDELSLGGETSLLPALPAEPLLGRDGDMSVARALLTGTEAGTGGTLLVIGEAGIGKTRFGEALLTEARMRGWAVVHGSASRAGGQVPWAPVTEAVDRLLVQRPDLVCTLPTGAREGLARLSGNACPSLSETGLRSRQPVLAAVAALLLAAARDRAALLWIDDVHEVDETTVYLLHYLGHLALQERLLILGTLRPDAVVATTGDARARLLAGLKVTRIELAPLSLDDTRSLVCHVAGRPVAEAAVRAIYERAEGNPFFTEELTRALGPDDLLTVPPRTYAAIEVRLGSLDPTLRAALQRVAVAGAHMTAGEFAALAGLEKTSALAVLDAALRSGVLVQAGDGYRFQHALVREALVTQMPDHQRRATCRRAAGVLAARSAAPVRVAGLLLAAGAGVDAVSWLERAARDAAEAGAVADTKALADRALRYAPHHAPLLALRADCLLAMGNPSALAAYSEAAAAARGGQRRALRIRQARAAIVLGDTATATRALDGVTAGNPGEAVRLHIARGYLDLSQGEQHRAREHASKARRTALTEGLVADLADAATLAALTAHSAGEWQHQVELDLLDTARAPQLAASVHDGHLCVAEHLLYGDQPYDRVIAFAARLGEMAHRNGAERGEAFATLLLGEAELLAGQRAAATDHLRQAAVLHHRVGSAAGESLSLQRLAEASLLSGHRAESLRLLRDALDLARRSSLLVRHLLPRIYGTMVRVAAGPTLLGADGTGHDGAAGCTAAAADGDALAVIAEAESAMTEAREVCRTCSITFTLPAAVACARAGELGRARQYLADARNASPPPSRTTAWNATLAEAEAVLATAAGDTTEAAQRLRAAVRLFAAAGQPADARRCRRALRETRQPACRTSAGQQHAKG